MKVTCRYEPPHTHDFPDDWVFGGPNNTDPRADPRWKPTTYIYLDEFLNPVWTTQTPICDDQAIDEFTKHAFLRPVFLQAVRPDSTVEMVAWVYNAEEDIVSPLGK